MNGSGHVFAQSWRIGIKKRLDPIDLYRKEFNGLKPLICIETKSDD